MASLGAVIIILALALDPFVQQAVTYQTSLQYNDFEDATIAAANTFRVSAENLVSERAIGSVLYVNDFDPPLHCPTAGCKWDDAELMV